MGEGVKISEEGVLELVKLQENDIDKLKGELTRQKIHIAKLEGEKKILDGNLIHAVKRAAKAETERDRALVAEEEAVEERDAAVIKTKKVGSFKSNPVETRDAPAVVRRFQALLMLALQSAANEKSWKKARKKIQKNLGDLDAIMAEGF